MGRPAQFRRDLAARGERYLLAVPSNTMVRDLTATPPPYRGRGPRPKTPFCQVRRWLSDLPESVWTRLEVRDGEKGPVTVEIVARRVVAKIDKKVGPEETLVAIRSREEDGGWKHDYYLSNAPADTPLAIFGRVANAQHRVEECLKRAKSEAGLADYQVRTWLGWHHHTTLSLIATWYLVQETRRGKKGDPRVDGPPSSPRPGANPSPSLGVRYLRKNRPGIDPQTSTQRIRQTLSP